MNCKRTAMRFMPTTVLCIIGMSGSFMSLAADAPAIASRPVLDDRYPQRRTQFPGGVTGLADVTYSTPMGFRPLTLDLYLRGGETRLRPLVIYIHGGGWQSGHTRHAGAFENWPGVLASLAARGYVVASIEYRLSGEARFPAAIHDVKASIKWLRAHSVAYAIDPQRVLLWGGSAGGQLAALAGTTCDVSTLEPPAGSIADATAGEVSDCIQGVVAWYGIFDFTASEHAEAQGDTVTLAADAAPARYLGCVASSCKQAALAAASAVTYVDARDPPVLLVHGIQDRTVPVGQSRRFYKALRARGVPTELVEIPDVDHSFLGATPESTRAASLRALVKTFEFIDQTVGPGP